MAKETILKDLNTGEELYPHTLAKFVYTEGGDNAQQAIDKAKIALFIDMWNNACGIYGRYNADTGFFELNGLTDITYQQAMTILQYAPLTKMALADRGYVFAKCNARTLPLIESYGDNYTGKGHYMFSVNKTIEAVNFGNLAWVDMSYAFYMSTIKIVRGLRCHSIHTTILTNCFSRCTNLETLELFNLNASVSLADSPRLSLESITYMTTNANNTAPITITLHPDAYARVTDEIFEAAIAKNITITSA